MNTVSNHEYLGVLSRLVEHIRDEYRIDGVPDLTADQIFRWLQQIDPEDIARVVAEIERRPKLEVMTQRQEKSSSQELREPVRAA